MPQYLCLDGPLGGQILEWRDPPPDGVTLTVGVVDVDVHDPAWPGPPEVDYVVEQAARGADPGRLRYLTRRGTWPVADAGAHAPV